jgi:hypothetical protein
VVSTAWIVLCSLQGDEVQYEAEVGMNEVGGRLEVQNTMFALGTHAPTVHAKARPGKDLGKHQTNARIHYDRLPDHTLLQ